MAQATLLSWLVGRDYPKGSDTVHSKPLIRPAMNPPPTLSFWNLIEGHVLRSLRTDHGVKMDALRRAIHYAEQHLGIDRLLLSPALRANAGKLLLERYGELIELSASGQVAKPIAIDPKIAFGRPELVEKGIQTHTIVERIDAGEFIEDLAEDYDLTPEQVGEAVLYERAA